MTVSRIAVAILFPVTILAGDLCGAHESDAIPGGELQIIAPDGEGGGVCPLRHTDVQADITGLVSRVTVRQEFYNPLDQKIEAIYVFPLPHDAAVDDMNMTVGDREIVGLIKPRDEARNIYETARAAGHVTSLLDQERPNIFTQSVANIEPGLTVVIEISYVHMLKYEAGLFEFTFPMVVGPRYIPGGGSAPAPMTTGQPTQQVPDGHKITPPVTPPGTRAGHDISLTVNIDAGAKIAELSSALHRVNVERPIPGHAVVTLASRSEIPNKDFVLRYSTSGVELRDALFTHTDARGTFFTLLLQPPKRIVPDKIVPREIVFVLDTSGSMSGFPIEKAKQVMTQTIDQMRPGDSFNLITFAGSTRVLWPQPRPNTPQNRNEAKQFLASQRGGGGTEMMQAIHTALTQPPRVCVESEPAHDTNDPMRVVCFMTDGYVGNDMAIIDAVKNNAHTTRVFSFGVGNSVNRFLLDGMASAGRGEVEYVTLSDDGDAAVARFCDRISAPVLADIQIDWGSLPVSDTYPKRVPDVFSAKPIMIHGRMSGTPSGTITLRGRTGAGSFERKLEVSPSVTSTQHTALASLWARAKIEDLMTQDYAAMQHGQFPEHLEDQVTALGVDYRLMTQFTSFVAVEKMRVTKDGQLVTINVPVEMPDGVSYEGVFGRPTPHAVALQLQSSRSRGQMLRKLSVPSSGMRFDSAPSPTVNKSVGERRSGGIHVLGDVGTADSLPFQADGAKTHKLSPILRNLAEKVKTDGVDGNLTIGGLHVVDFKIDIRVTLADSSEATMNTLRKLGFIQQAESKTIRMVIGRIDVRRLTELEALDVVLGIVPL